MTEDSLEGVEFTSGSETRTAGEFIDTIHDPDILYYHIQDAHEKAESGPDIDTDGKEREVELHSQIEVFQSSIQYVEAFGIYLLSYIKDRENLIENLVQIEPKHLKPFFESLKDDTVDEYLQRQGIDGDYRDTLERLFGYAFIDNIEDDEVSEDEVKEAINESIDVLDANIRRIGEFYLYFHDIYNAVKHGNRSLPQAENTLNLSRGDEEETSIELDMDFILFVCRNDQAEPYLVTVPIQYLIKHSLDIVEKVHSVFNYLKRVSNAATTEEPVDLSFFRFKETAEEPEYEWLTATHKSGVIVLPRIEELEELQEPIEWTFPAKIEVDHCTLYIKTRFDDDTSQEYPMLLTVLQRGLVGLTPQPIMGIDFDFNIEELDVVQYHELLNLEEATLEKGGVDEIILYDEKTDQTIDTGKPENFNFEPAEEKLLTKEEIEQLAWLQKISGERIPIPFHVAQKQGDVIQNCIESNVTEESANEAVKQLREIGEINHVTTVYVEQMLPTGQKISSTEIGKYPGEIQFDDMKFETEEGRENFEEKWGESGATWGLNVTGYEGSPSELIELLEDDFSKLEDVLAQIDVPQGEPDHPIIRVEYELGVPEFWYTENTLRLQFPPQEVRVNIRQNCPLCNSQISTDLATHLAEDCEASIPD